MSKKLRIGKQIGAQPLIRGEGNFSGFQQFQKPFFQQFQKSVGPMTQQFKKPGNSVMSAVPNPMGGLLSSRPKDMTQIAGPLSQFSSQNFSPQSSLFSTIQNAPSSRSGGLLGLLGGPSSFLGSLMGGGGFSGFGRFR